VKLRCDWQYEVICNFYCKFLIHFSFVLFSFLLSYRPQAIRVFPIFDFSLHYEFLNRQMAAELVNSATNDKLAEVDWTKNIEICELVAHDERYNILSAVF